MRRILLYSITHLLFYTLSVFLLSPLLRIVLYGRDRVSPHFGIIRCKETEFFVFLSSLFSLAAFNITLFPLVFVEGTSSHIGVSHTHTPCTLSHSMYSSYNTLFPLVFVEGNCSHSVAPLRAPYTFEKKRVCYSINDTYNSHSFQWFREVVPSTPPLPWSNCSSSVVRSPHSTRRSPEPHSRSSTAAPPCTSH
jgi:hypothetical protein